MTGVETYLPAAAVVLLAGFVVRWHKPWLATVVLTVILGYRDYGARHPPVYLLLHSLIYLCVGGVLFWAIDRSTQLVLTIGLVLAGSVVVQYLL
jgi:hypothetical protein